MGIYFDLKNNPFNDMNITKIVKSVYLPQPPNTILQKNQLTLSTPISLKKHRKIFLSY